MTAEQHAKELVNKFKPHVYPFIGSSFLTGDEDEGVKLMMSKICAEIALDFSIERIKALHLKNYANTIDFKATSAHKNEISCLQEIKEAARRITLEKTEP